MRCLQITAIDADPVLTEIPAPRPGPDEVVVALRAAALNHRDEWIRRGRYPGLALPVVPGSDGAGVVVEAPAGAAGWLGAEVVINPAMGWGPSPAAQESSFSILGMPRQGTCAERIAVPVSQLARRPAHLSWHQAAALPLAGLTAWRALTWHGRAAAGMRVLIHGIGGGVALTALVLARSLGCRVSVTSSDADKRRRALDLGAEAAYDWQDPEWVAASTQDVGAADLAIDGAGGDGLNRLIDAVRPGGSIVLYGATAGVPKGFDLRKLFWRQIRLQGSTMGSPDDWAALLAHVTDAGVVPVVDSIRPLAAGAEAFRRMADGHQFGKLVLEIQD